MTKDETIADLTVKLDKCGARVARLKKRLETKMKYEKGLLKGTGAHPHHIIDIEQKDLIALHDT